jgi:hypothetical protein
MSEAVCNCQQRLCSNLGSLKAKALGAEPDLQNITAAIA